MQNKTKQNKTKQNREKQTKTLDIRRENSKRVVAPDVVCVATLDLEHSSHF